MPEIGREVYLTGSAPAKSRAFCRAEKELRFETYGGGIEYVGEVGDGMTGDDGEYAPIKGDEGIAS
jgi:hypothetical protein